MNIDNIAVRLRLRNHWEAIDLGFAMARQWYFELLAIWLLLALPVFALVHLAVSFEHLVYAGLAFWWFKPLYEKPVLYYLSRKLFGGEPRLKTMPKQVFSINKRNFFATILWRRISLTRSFAMPVSLLEGLGGSERKARLGVLKHSAGSGAQWLTIAGVHIEAFLDFALIALVFMLAPENMLTEDVSYLIFNQPPWMVYLFAVCYGVAAAIVAPFYVAAGFALYISRRTELEGWDIELEFKKLAHMVSTQGDAPNQAADTKSSLPKPARSVQGGV